MKYSTNTVTRRERDCLVSLTEGSSDGFPMRLHQIATVMKVKPPTALNVVRRLEQKGLAESRDGMVLLTKSGDQTAQKILLVHRTYESLFCQSGIPASEACAEAAVVDFIIPEDNAKMVLKKIGSPTKCPHGKPIQESE